MSFKPGDKVICIKVSDLPCKAELGRVHRVSHQEVGDPRWFYVNKELYFEIDMDFPIKDFMLLSDYHSLTEVEKLFIPTLLE